MSQAQAQDLGLEEEAPYYAPPADLPAPLPTTDEIKNATDIIADDNGHPKVVCVGPYVIKYGRGVDLYEGKNMMFVEQATTTGAVRLPRVYAFFEDAADECTYIIMEKIQGQTLKALWPSLDDARKDRICRQIKASVTELRAMPSPTGGYCAPGNRPLRVGLYPDVGPVDTEAEFNDALLEHFLRTKGGYKALDPSDPMFAMLARHLPTLDESLKKHSWAANWFRRQFSAVFRDHPPTFAHGDLKPENIMVDPQNNDMVTLIDWRKAGWYPSYWEYFPAVMGCTNFYNTDWDEWLDRVLVPYPNEYVWQMFLWCNMYN
ncbi:hypothetical protein PV08_06977 [Exophiala spinifera]|uniref:Aminoglycoside phosphotransferase domain-containing protein n=1 Tax=Exophiala spinifera TaxID=91928 RepID=A0A0D1YGS3_9EURO|nr:uncharacterized protein PV08_06977 [Exophiala spinifera]KIW14196.1 hypothetical protein PV08_06977 [Exophiala spinifera]